MEQQGGDDPYHMHGVPLPPRYSHYPRLQTHPDAPPFQTNLPDPHPAQYWSGYTVQGTPDPPLVDFHTAGHYHPLDVRALASSSSQPVMRATDRGHSHYSSHGHHPADERREEWHTCVSSCSDSVDTVHGTAASAIPPLMCATGGSIPPLMPVTCQPQLETTADAVSGHSLYADWAHHEVGDSEKSGHLESEYAPVIGFQSGDSDWAARQCREEYEGSFMAKAQKFVMKNAECFNMITEESHSVESDPHDSSNSLNYAQPEALEYHMLVSKSYRHSRLLKVVEAGDVVRGFVTCKRHGDLMVQVMSFVDSPKLREFSDLDIQGVVSYDNLHDELEERAGVETDMEIDDVVQAVVTGRSYEQTSALCLSFREDHFNMLSKQLSPKPRLGYMRSKRSRTWPILRSTKEGSFLDALESDSGFTNPHCVENLKTAVGTGPKNEPGVRHTLLKDLKKAVYEEAEFYDSLRKNQKNKWSMDTVAVGVKLFKAGEHSKAMQQFSLALTIAPSNVEGLVARGALYANAGKYREAISDFEAALTVNTSHRNAKNYLVETHVAYGQQLQREGSVEAAMRCYREALADDPSQTTAREGLALLTAALEKQAAERREQELKRAEEKATLKRLQNIIHKEKKRGTKKLKNKKRKKKLTKKAKKQARSHHHRRSHYSSDSSDESTATASSDGRSSASSLRGHSHSRTHHRPPSHSPAEHRHD